MSIPTDYYENIAELESSNNPNAYNSGSHASGLYQFEPGTWTSLGYSMSDIFNPDVQNEAIQTLTNQNANGLTARGVDVNDTSLYAAHVLGVGHAAQILNASPSTSLASIIGTKAASLNSWLGSTAGSAVSAISNKIGSAGNAVASLGNSLTGEASSVINGVTGTLGAITNPVGSILQQLQSWLFNSSFFVRIALAVFAIIILVAGFMMLKPVQEVVATGAKAAAA